MHLTSSRAHWALSFLALLAAFTTSDSNPDPQPVAENFNPEDADPAYAIACFGGWSDQSLPRMGSFDPTGPFDPMERTLQHLCVKPQYRGGARGQHAGGFCAPGTVNEFDKRVVVFDASPAAQISKELAQPSFLLECWYRCFCVWDDKGHQNIKPPIDFDVSLFTRPRLDTETTQISIPSRDWTPEEQEPVRDTEPDTALALRLITNLSQDKLHAGEQPQPLTTDISLDPQNEIACDGPLPIWPLPAPIGLPPFLYHDLKHLCAVNLNDGAAWANAGGYCNARQVTDFAEWQTPRLDWTYRNYPFPLVLRYHCFKHCWCNDRQGIAKKKNPEAVWRVIEQPDLKLSVWGGDRGPVWYRVLRPNLPPQLGLLLPPALQPRPQAGPCGDDRRQFCSNPWPSDLMGPRPKYAPDIVYESDLGDKQWSAQCGGDCYSMSDCSDSHDEGCRCMFPDKDTATRFGLDPQFPKAMCLAVAMADPLNSNNLERDVGKGALNNASSFE